ncbi:Adaptin N terminal region family protein [Trichomonas vaginalis G3]|uniref:AP-1 complex subunit gamma n=1 Tax=Trichomonas vaginalis (strain ATCC PRA-98 / G3) TaxID=412133 RepID=A2EE10_TRIV3|nr:intracellular protein transport [Trichomonas vaginalis G3]EAY09122.1 Adaptin N terminal region family protein [Trichomonas vaginalis G3]KAI5502646.1 intracellular protein transport [Trichomonas vaginalis G3]|eukprot:XP_001321345.1 Adaptin N terminal region family protein [Trichomonas vaginalis G3]
MATNFEDFIVSILETDTIEDERVVISNELANMRTFIRDCSEHYKPRLVLKLMYLDMIGENTAWGQMEIVSLMAHDRPSYKRIGYLAAANILDEDNERIVLITHTMQKDLTSPNPLVQMLPLTLLANIGAVEMCRTLVTDVQKLLDSPLSAMQKRAAMASVHIIRKVPELSDSFRPYVQKLLNHSAHCCVMAGIMLALEMLKVDPDLANQWGQFCTPFTKILKNLYEARPSSEFSFSIFNDPFLQIKIMKILAHLKRPSEELDELLASIITSVDVRRNTGRSILFQAIQTINTCAKKASLRSLAYNQIGRLFTFPEPNVLYSALSAFSQILYNENQIIDRSSADSVVLQRYKSQVVSCLDHKDASIRRRALDVITALVDESNVEVLIPDVNQYLRMADGDFRIELVAKVFASVQRFAPSPEWNFTTVLNILIDSGNYVGNDVISSICKLIGQHQDLRYKAVKLLTEKLPDNSSNQSLVQVAAWTIGEFLEEESDAPEILKRILLMPQTTIETKCYIIIALAKVAVRFNRIPEMTPVFEDLAKSNNLEIQQRAGEILHILSKKELYDDLLVPLEFEEAPVGEIKSQHNENLLDLEMEAPQQKQQQPVDAVAALLGAPVAQPQQQQPAVQQLLADASKGTSPQKVTPKKEITPPKGAVEALRTQDYVIYFEFQRNQNNPNQLAIRASCFNLGEVPLTQFQIQYGLPQGWMISPQQPSGNVLEPIGGRPIMQVLMLQNKGVNKLQMRTQITYLYRSQPLKENGTINQAIFG